MVPRRRFADRVQAGRLLLRALPELGGELIVLGLARGGVPVAAELARGLDAPLDVLVVRKVGHPAQPEYALGAVSEDGVALPGDLPEELVAPHRAEARRLGAELRAGREPPPLAGRTAIVADDGLATGRSMAAALESVRRRGAARIVVAVPVASGPAFRALSEDVEVHAIEIVEPPEFFAVGQFYEDFGQVSTAEVAALLSGAGLERSS